MTTEGRAVLRATEPPSLTGWAGWQARWVDKLKRTALHDLHASRRGEMLLLRMYLAGEEATEIALRHQSFGNRPPWLVRQMAQHLAEEQGHAQAFGAALRARGGVPRTQLAKPDWLSRWKIGRWQALAARFSACFGQGALVPAFAIGLCAEQMATRVLTRHCQVIGPRHPMHHLLAGVLADEAKHVRLCQHTLSRLVQPDEQAALSRLLAEVRAVDRAFGISGALGLLLAGKLQRWFGALRRVA